MNEELKVCPFCGGEARIRTHDRTLTETKDHFYIECFNAPCYVAPKPENFSCKDEAITAWNTRPREQELEEENANLRQVMLTHHIPSEELYKMPSMYEEVPSKTTDNTGPFDCYGPEGDKGKINISTLPENKE